MVLVMISKEDAAKCEDRTTNLPTSDSSLLRNQENLDYVTAIKNLQPKDNFLILNCQRRRTFSSTINKRHEVKWTYTPEFLHTNLNQNAIPSNLCDHCLKEGHSHKHFAYPGRVSLSSLGGIKDEEFSEPKKAVYYCQSSKFKRLKLSFFMPRTFHQTLLLLALFCLLQLSPIHASKHKRSRNVRADFDISHRDRLFNQPLVLDQASFGSRWLSPSVINLASHAVITSNATCGLRGPVKYCKLVEHVDRRWTRRGQQCSMCNSRSALSSERHPIENAIDGRGDTWWQSPTIEQGYQYHWVTITLDLKQVFQVAYVIVKAANSARPGNWILEKSTDGNTWEPWQYFAISDSECFKAYGLPPARTGAPKYLYDTEVMCTTYFSRLNPLDNGEIHVSLINGRPSAENPSPYLVSFTSTRYIRLRLQKIRTLHGELMTRSHRLPGYADPLVTRRYYYSIKDISVGGMCICYGHASSCFSNSSTGEFTCHCEHNTVGRNCEACDSGFNQYEWQPGNDGFKCEACNCHGHSEECYYDVEVAARRESLNINGEYSGGGVCVGCRDNTAGINCETCTEGYYRPVGVPPRTENPCRPCSCNAYGGARVTNQPFRFLCINDVNQVNADEDLFPGHCVCKTGFSGEKCDRCAPGYQGFPFCEPCSCNISGSLNTNLCQGQCVCKKNVRGERCSECAEGYYDLQASSLLGCDQCYCFGATTSCQSSNRHWSNIRINYGWEIRVKGSRRKVSALLDSELHEPYFIYENVAQLLGSSLFYWSAPREYLGAKLDSYGGYLSFVVSYDILDNSHPLLIQYADVILEGNRKTLIYNSRGMLLEPQVEKKVSIRLASIFTSNNELGWIDETTLQPVTKEDMMLVLLDIKKLLIRAVYSRNAKAIYRISNVKLSVAQPNGKGSVASSVEICQCPPGYSGNSCERCQPGYWRSATQCLPCRCHGHATNCNQINGACENCLHNTMGMHCETCKPGFYGDATWGTSRDCQSCACPLPIASNNFSPTCRLNRNNGDMICLQCPRGYTGKRCEICDDGYFGEPAVPNSGCQLCQCNGNSARCDRKTGRCLSCENNTVGEHCERCKAAYYGDAINENDCKPCDCNPVGSLTRQCNVNNGQCICKQGIFGRKCDTCPGNHYLNTVARTCVTCDCSTSGSISQQCQANGNCICKSGVEGRLCDVCAHGYYDFSPSGCKACDCESTNGNCNPVTGECTCPLNTEGFKCSQCTPGSYQWRPTLGCKNCDCSRDGTVAGTQCNNVTGVCHCKSHYGGQQCDTCREGYFGFPNCRPCQCNIVGTLTSVCSKSDQNVCNCSNNGQCFCKENVIGKQCDQCASGSFGFSSHHPHGCTGCFCSGVTNHCEQAEYVWGLPIFTDFSSPEPDNANQVQLYTIFDVDSIGMRKKAYFWTLSQKFNGDKTLSYGGLLRYTIEYDPEILFYPDLNMESLVIIRGGESLQRTIQFKIEKHIVDIENVYTIPMREYGWKNTPNGKDVSRSEFFSVLENIQLFLIKSSDGFTFGQSRLISVSLDSAVPGLPGRGDDTSDYSVAEGLEKCFCPVGYAGLSCQDCAVGYMRVQQGSGTVRCQPCNCNNRSSTCLIETGECLNCVGNFVGSNCERCRAGFYLDGDICRKCQCPGTGPDNNFSDTCRADIVGEATEFTCDSCLVGYTGKHCEICAEGYYGNPVEPGGFCAKCGCNVAGSVDALCDIATGQCHCDVGIQGRICDQCQPRHVITSQGCLECKDGCVELLLDEIEILRNISRNVVVNNVYSLPWNQLRNTENQTSMMQGRLSHVSAAINDTLLYLDGVNVSTQQQEAKLNLIEIEAQSCVEDLNYLVSRTSAIRKRSRSLKTESRSLLNTSQVTKKDIKTLLGQLEIGRTQDTSELKANVDVLVGEMKRRNMSSYDQLVQLDVEITQMLLDSRVKNFTSKATKAEEKFLVEKQNLLDDLDALFFKFNDTNLKFAKIDRLQNVARRKNNMNKQLLSQAGGEIEKVRNQASITNSLIKNGTVTFKMASELYESGRFFINMLTDEQLVRSSLRDAKDDISNLLLTKLNPAPEELMQKVKKVVEDYKRNLQAKANYTEQVYQEVNQISVNQTEAASRWTNIANSITEANKIAVMAKKTAEESLNSARSNLVRKAETSLRQSNQVRRSVITQGSAVDNGREQLRYIHDELRSVALSADELKRKHDLLLFQLNRANSGFLSDQSSVTPEDVHKAVRISEPTVALVNEDYKNLQQISQKLDVAYRKAQQHENIKEKVVESLDAVPEEMRNLDRKLEEAQDKSTRVALLNENIQRNISSIRKLIEDARRKAASIRVSVKSSGSCSMRYEPVVKSSTNTEIILNVKTTHPNNLLFYLARENQDYLAVETRNHYVVVTWDLGGGAGVVENPVRVSSSEDNDWYRIEINRRNQAVNVTVYQIADKIGTSQIARGLSPSTYTVLDIDRADLLYIGGTTSNVELPVSVIHRTFTGCMGEAFLQGKNIGLWNFKAINNKSDCVGCQPSKSHQETDNESNLYSFSGLSYSVIKLPSNYRSDETRFSLKFQTFSSAGLFFFLGSKLSDDFMSLELFDGRLLLKLDLGDGLHTAVTRQQYNDGKWTHAIVSRNLNVVTVTVNRDEEREERTKTTFSAFADTSLDLNSNDNLYVGGIPTQISIGQNVTRTSFVGCLREFVFMRRTLKLKEGSESLYVLQERGVSYTCPAEITRDIGISNEGYIEIPPISLPTSSSLSMTFSTRKSNAVLLFATKTKFKKFRQKRLTDTASYSLFLSNGHVNANIYVDGKVALNLTSKQNHYSSGRAHSVSLTRQQERWTLQMNDDQKDKVTDILNRNAGRVVTAGRLFVGGISRDIIHLAPTNTSVNGCIGELVINNLIDFKQALRSKNSYFGTCLYVDYAPIPSGTPPTNASRAPDSIHSMSTFETTTTSPLKDDGDGFVDRPSRKPDDLSCRAPGVFEVRNNSANFGSSPHSHLTYVLESKLGRSFTFEMKVRTLSDSGLLLYASHQAQRDFFALKLKDGKPLFQFDNGKGRAEVVALSSINDGRWHKIKIRRHKRKGLLMIDKQKVSVTSKKGASIMDVSNILYVGGLPEDFNRKKLGQIHNSMDICVRDLTLNKNTSLKPLEAYSSFQVQSCFNKITSGAYFNGTGYAVHAKQYRVGQNMLIEMDFRTWRSNGVILSVDNNRMDGLAIEIVNGSIFFRTDNGGGPFEVNYTSPSAFGSNRKRIRYPLCDGRWHRLRAEKRESTLRLSVDDFTVPAVISTATTSSADTNDPLYIGGIPDDNQTPMLLRTTDNFEGCIRDLRIKTRPISFDESFFRRGVFPKSCPIPTRQKGKKAKLRRTYKTRRKSTIIT